MEKKLDDLIEHTVPENYEEYIKNFDDTKKDSTYVTPRRHGISDFDFVDQSSQENLLAGYAGKYCVKVDISLLRDLVKEIKTNPNSSYQTCYTNKQIREDDITTYFSAIIKEPNCLIDIESEVLGSRILNYFGIPVVYNRRIDRAIPRYSTEHYLISVDAIRQNERLVLLKELIPVGAGVVDINNFEQNGLKKTLDVLGEHLKNYLDAEGINYTNKDIDDFKHYTCDSLRIRRLLLGDIDLRNGNCGVLLDLKKKTFRPFPNFDMEMCHAFHDTLNYNAVKQIYDYDPEGFERFIAKMMEFFQFDENKNSDCIKLIYKNIRDKKMADGFIDRLYLRAVEIVNMVGRVKPESNKYREGVNLNQVNIEKA